LLIFLALSAQLYSPSLFQDFVVISVFFPVLQWVHIFFIVLAAVPALGRRFTYLNLIFLSLLLFVVLMQKKQEMMKIIPFLIWVSWKSNFLLQSVSQKQTGKRTISLKYPFFFLFVLSYLWRSRSDLILVTYSISLIISDIAY